MTVFNVNQSTPAHLADLPTMVTPKILAEKLDIKTQSIYQRIWRHKKAPLSDLLPLAVHLPGSNRIAFTRQSVIDWWLRAQLPQANLPIQFKGVGRPSIAQQQAKVGR